MRAGFDYGATIFLVALQLMLSLCAALQAAAVDKSLFG